VTDDDDESMQHRPTSLLAHINAATRNTIMGSNSPFAMYGSDKSAAGGPVTAGLSSHGHGTDADDGYEREDTPSEAMGLAVGGDSDEMGRPARVRYSFDGTEEGELPLSAGLEVIILDDRDPA
jgi:hypothetical protein